MAEQAAPDATAGEHTEPHGQASLTRGAGAHPSEHGRPTSWATAVIVIVGFVVGGVALTIGPAWWLFWTGVGIVGVGVLFGGATRIFDDWY
ncbi:MAG: hypothetical protein JO132_16065 [Streptosporangiaceae bacterium]|nr:hypothetical protein [Streptosporangiaceae bacterium]